MILGLCGSLRQNSLNRMVLTALQSKVPDLVVWKRMGELPFFNPDLELQPNDVIDEYRANLKSASAIVIASPEYAHGVTGVMKNALDWVVGTGEFMQKSTIVLNCSRSATIANFAIRETLSVMEAEVHPFSIPLRGHSTTVEEILQDTALLEHLKAISRLLTNLG